ncbi:MAG TPA: T9SS type A sorting domain-containing protein [Bacteroidales bacterium]|nr:T9SS type A sorting domain-containing protein [Bacteroidales bacterium]
MKKINSLRLILLFLTSLTILPGFGILDAPLLKNIEKSDISYTGSVIVSKSIDIQDKDNEIASALVTVSSGFIPGEDKLNVAAPDGISSSWDNGSGTLSLTGTAKTSSYQRAFRSVQYSNSSDTPTPGRRTVSFTVNDGESVSNTLSRAININSADTTPPPQPPPDTTPPPQPPPDTTPPPQPPPDTTPPPQPPPDTTPPPQPPPDTTPPPQPPPEKPAPTAVISGNKTVCEGDKAVLEIAFTGTAPFSVTVLRNNEAYQDLSGIQGSSYNLEVMDDGTYSLKGLKDANKEGDESGTAVVVVHESPSARISGDVSICGGGETPLNVTLSGNPPYQFSYRLNSGTAVLVQHVESNSYSLKVNRQGTYTLAEVQDKYCRGDVSGSAKVTFSEAPDVKITGLKSSYSNTSKEWVELRGDPSGGEFTGSGILKYQNKWFFLPSLAKVGNNRIIYKYNSQNSCTAYDTAVVKIFESTAEIEFEQDRTMFCANDRPFVVKGTSMSSSKTGSFSISGGTGLTDNGDNTATIDPAIIPPGEYTITFVAGDGVTVNRKVEIGESLKADFSWETECYTPEKAIAFTNHSSSPFGFLDESSYTWSIFNERDSVNLHAKDITYNFAEPGNYTIALIARNSNGCIDTALKTLRLSPIVRLAGQNYFESFEQESSWYAGNNPEIPENSWKLDAPQRHGFPPHGFKGPWSGQKSWFTDILTSPVVPEQSWINSPCFDFTGTSKPTFIAHVWRAFTDNRDGANLQYSTDNGKTWQPVGKIDDGINWFNGYFGPAGEQAQGWTAKYDTGWVEVRHELDFLKDQPEVQFRVVYTARGTAIGNDGIALDDIRIAERNRTVLLEHFTNTQDEKSVLADSLVNRIVDDAGSNIIDIRYHTDNPAGDPFNADNPALPGTRSFYYSVSRIPYTVINGGTQSRQRIDYINDKPDDNQLSVESLYDSDFDMDVTSMLLDDTLYTEAAITAITDVPAKELSVRLAIIESSVEDDQGRVSRNVVKAMIPDAAGTVLFKSWLKDETIYVRQKWGLENVYDSSDLRVVAFIQDETTHEVYQSALDTKGTVTGNENVTDETGSWLVFPNPARDIIYVNFNARLNGPVDMQVINNIGQVVYAETVASGTSMISIPAGGLPTGLYLIRFTGEDGFIHFEKVMISR